jgi:hypothetical protein
MAVEDIFDGYGNRIGADRQELGMRTDADAIACSPAAPETFELVFEPHFAAVLRYLRRRVGAFAEDLAAETFTLDISVDFPSDS